MNLSLPDAAGWAELCNGDGEFALAARHWDGGLRISIGDATLSMTLGDGVASGADPGAGAGVLGFTGPPALWEKLLAAEPPPYHNDIAPLLANGLERTGDRVLHAQYYPAVMRALELLRPGMPGAAPMRDERTDPGHFDSPTGRYVHVTLAGHDHRVYFEEAGTGIPLLLQHTAGSHGSQWRHLFEIPEITSRFRLIAYDLPFHGKSLPPLTRAWWSEPYRLTGEFLRSVPVALAQTLALDRPVFMGCSVGGLLALDLALHHPEVFRAVIAVEGALWIPDSVSSYPEFWHPQVSNDYKARVMDGLMAPSSPIAYRRETTFAYASGWPAAFLGDLHYYMEGYDLRERAGDIDTSRIGVHILSGEYDFSGTPELGRAAHEAIPGSTWQKMKGVGHFPMSENPMGFIEHLLPVLARLGA